MLLILAFNLFIMGFIGLFVVRQNLIVMLMSIELMLLGLNVGFIYTSIVFDDQYCQVIALLILTIAATESALGLAILLVYYRVRRLINVNFITFIKS